MTESVDELLTTADVSALMEVKQPTLRKWRREHRGPESFQMEGLVRYRKSAVLAYIAEQEAAARARRSA